MADRVGPIVLTVLFLLVLSAAGCSDAGSERGVAAGGPQAEEHAGGETMPDLATADLAPGEKLRVVATTSIVADVVRNVGGDVIELAALIPTGADPHGYTPTPQDMRLLNEAHVIFLNGLGLEESLAAILENLDRPVPLVSVNAGVKTLALAGDDHEDDHQHEGGADPHTWFSVPNVSTWAGNIAAALSELDPGRAGEYAAAAAAYQGQLAQLDTELRGLIDSVPAEQRKLVTDHVALGYLADEYGFETVGSVLPSSSTLAAASAQELASLQQAMDAEQVRALFVSSTVNAQTATQLAEDLGIPVVKIYTGSLSESGGPASTYIDLMRYDVAQILDALR